MYISLKNLFKIYFLCLEINEIILVLKNIKTSHKLFKINFHFLLFKLLIKFKIDEILLKVILFRSKETTIKNNFKSKIKINCFNCTYTIN